MLSIETYKEQKETKKLQKITLKKEKMMSDNKKKSQLSSWAEMLRVKKATKKGKSTKPKKKKQITRWKLVKMLDSIFSRYIRLSYADNNGMVKCVTSGDMYHWKNIQNGHFITRWNYKYRWDEKNCYPQCYVDNCIKNWNYKEYTLFMIRTHWQIVVENMITDKELVKISTPRIKEQIEHYEKCVKEILDTKWL